MARTVAEIVVGLEALTADDFDDDNALADGPERLYDLCDDIAASEDRAACAQAMFALMERLDVAELGTPGPLVHTLERWRGQYEVWLSESLRRKPSPLSVWMANRILNGDPADPQAWLMLLEQVREHPAASAATKVEAAGFLEFQHSR